VKQETPVNHGELICFSIYSHNSSLQADFGNGKSCIWVDVLDGGRDVLMEFMPFFEDPLIKKVILSSSLFVASLSWLLTIPTQYVKTAPTVG
jgi:hypothetical protein